ncbi:neuraminidase [Streptomyces sp. Mg1]|nr:neuraminidase [Streptomyces sp. Mg1]RPK47201.1 Laminin G domain protein [Streptomyces sp. ADI91-18]
MIIGHAHTESDPMPSPAPQVPGGQRRFPRPARLYGLPLGLLAATALTLAPSPATGAPAAAAPATENPVPAVVSTPFAAGDDGYHCTRIPALVTTGSGALLAFAEGRVRGSEGCSTPGRSGYSDLALLADRSSIGVVYETATTIPHGSVVFTSFTEARMDAARTELRRPRTPDTSAHHNDAVVHGGARLGLRADGKAMEFDGKDDYLRLVGCTEALRVRQQDFTVTAWFRHAATGGGLPIVWAYGMSDAGHPNPKVRQFWLKAEPGQKRLRAAIQTDTSYAEVKTDSSYNDGAWHHVVFKREAGRLLLSVDGGTEFSAPAPAGDITPPGQFNIHVGARPDFPNQATGVKELFNGGLDDIRLFGRALTRAESAKVRAGATDVATDQERLRLAFETAG